MLAVGSVNKLLPIPGVAEHAHGFRGLPEALYLRDHIVRQFEIAADADDPAERAARCTFVVVGAGYTGTEVAAQGVLFTDNLRAAHPELRDQPVRWMLLDTAERVLPELDERLSATADRVLRERGRRGPDGRLGRRGGRTTAYGSPPASSSRPARWSGASASGRTRSSESLGLKTEKGRLVVDEFMRVPGHPEVFACGDAAAVPDVTRPGQATAMTAQHAQRQGKLVARNVAASLGRGTARRYKHHDLGFVVDLGGARRGGEPAARAAGRVCRPRR